MGFQRLQRVYRACPVFRVRGERLGEFLVDGELLAVLEWQEIEGVFRVGPAAWVGVALLGVLAPLDCKTAHGASQVGFALRMTDQEIGPHNTPDFQIEVDRGLLRRLVLSNYVTATRLYPWVFVVWICINVGVLVWSLTALSRVAWGISAWYAYIPLALVAYELVLLPKHHLAMVAKYEAMWPVGSGLASQVSDDMLSIATSTRVGWMDLPITQCESFHVQFGIVDASFDGAKGRMALPVELTNEAVRNGLRQASLVNRSARRASP